MHARPQPLAQDPVWQFTTISQPKYLPPGSRARSPSQMSTEALRVSHRAYVFGTILTATSFVEAMIKEVCLSATGGTPYSEFGLAEDRAAAIAALWSQPDRKR